MSTKLLFSVLLASIGSLLYAQSASTLTVEDYKRAERFQREYFREKVYNVNVTPRWFEDSTGFWYEIAEKGKKEFRRVDFPKMESKTAFDHIKLAEALNKTFNLEVSATNLPLNNLAFKGKDVIEFEIKNQLYNANVKSFTINKKERTPRPERNEMEQKSPDGKWIAFSKDYNLFIRSAETGEEIQLSKSGERHYEYASDYGWGDIIEGEDGERPQRFRVSWSPDSKMILANICDTRLAQKMYLLDWSVDTLYRPKLLGYYRGSPGDSTMVYYKSVIFDIEKRKEILIDIPPTAHIVSPSFRWMPDSEQLIGSARERGYKNLVYFQVNAQTGNIKNIYAETSETSVNDAFYQFRLLEKLNKIIFTSEMSGWNHLYLLDILTGKYIQLTKGKYLVNDILRVDEVNKIIYFTAMGKEPERNIYLQHLYSVDFEGKEVKLLTPENAHHIISFSPDGKYFVDNFSTVTLPTVTFLRSTTDPKVKLELSIADASELFATGWQAPETHIIIADDGESEIYCAIWKPSNFDPSKSYPVIDYSYTGPFTFRYPRSFSNGLATVNQALAELGFIIMHIDGRGSAGRSKAFRDYSYKRLGYGLVDHKYAIEELAKQHSWIDATRVGIFGHSAGGYDAGRGMLLFPDFYKVGVASSGDHDHRMEKAWWPEMYMGWPIDSAYHNQSNITNAANLKGKLLLVHGGIDENVNPSATFKLGEALIKADKEFDMLIIPSQRHGYSGAYGEYFNKKRMNYFVEHLLGAEPIWNYK
ncbi:MAG: DPP IV N-terminal domain-containing protein [Saprospiraceae bacterium]|nr:DPP IV N-terminal domain-containing protein [Saprospiraceae bacterium]